MWPSQSSPHAALVGFPRIVSAHHPVMLQGVRFDCQCLLEEKTRCPGTRAARSRDPTCPQALSLTLPHPLGAPFLRDLVQGQPQLCMHLQDPSPENPTFSCWNLDFFQGPA